jgi:urease accessory protein
MEIIHHSLAETGSAATAITLAVERGTLAKRRWRGVASDGREFGFDLEKPLRDGESFASADGKIYAIAQKPEPVLELSIEAERAAASFVRLGWIIGNLHFPLALDGSAVLTPDDPALRQLFDREGLRYVPCEKVFRPLSGGHSHTHDDGPGRDHHHDH